MFSPSSGISKSFKLTLRLTFLFLRKPVTKFNPGSLIDFKFFKLEYHEFLNESGYSDDEKPLSVSKRLP